MKLLKRSNYNNKEVINCLKTNFSILESSKCKFITSEFLEMDKLEINFDGELYKVALLGLRMKGANYHLVSQLKSDVIKNFNNRVDAIKYILFNLGIIRESELNN
tara:strand:- start:1449 stop:1763 length:315 start_codon:yes stop_codon:yes gene_type:complete